MNFRTFSDPQLSKDGSFFCCIESKATASSKAYVSKINTLWQESGDLGKYLDVLSSHYVIEEESSLRSVSTQSSDMSGDLGTWGKFGIYPDICDEGDMPGLNMASKSGGTMLECDWLKCTGRNVVNKQVTQLKMVLRDKGLTDLSLAIGSHRNLQCLDLAYNRFCDISALGNLRHLMNLDLSYNCLREAICFKAPWYLTHVDMSHNSIIAIYDLTEFWSLVYLDFSYNKIKRIVGLENLKHLRTLDLSHNEITMIENLNNLNILDLNLSYNQIFKSESGEKGLKTLKRLKYLNLENNEIVSLEYLQDISELQVLKLCNNKIEVLVELNFLKGMHTVVEASFVNNPVTTNRFYRANVMDVLRDGIISASHINVLWEESQDFGKFLGVLEPDIPSAVNITSAQSVSSQSTYLDGNLGSWGKLGIYPNKYDDRKSNEDLQLATVKGASLIECDYLRYFGRQPFTKQPVQLKLILRNKGLSNLPLAIGSHLYVQCLDLAHNYFEDISALGSLRHLMNLDLSYNYLTETLAFKAPWNLTHVDLSHNYIKSIYDLTEFWSLVYLDLSYNEINKIVGLENLKHLRNLNLSHNRISTLENLNNMNILDLNLSYNKISKLGNKNGDLQYLSRLKVLNLENNEIYSLEGFSGMKELQILILDNNNIDEILEITHLNGISSLSEVSFLNNLITKHKFYKSVVAETLKGVRMLDGEEISLKEKASIWLKYGNYPLLTATKVYKNLLKIERLNGGPVIGPHIMPCDEAPLPMVILVGPVASGKASLSFRMQYEYTDFIYWAKIYTTAEAAPICGNVLDKETQMNITGCINITCEEFCDKLRKGDFLAVTEFLGDSYGFCRSELGKAVTARKLCLFSTDLNMAKQLMLRRLCPTLILTIPKSSTLHFKFNIRKYGTTFVTYDRTTINIVKPIISNMISKVLLPETDTIENNTNANIADSDRYWSAEMRQVNPHAERRSTDQSARLIYASTNNVFQSLESFENNQFDTFPSCPPVSEYTSTDNIPTVISDGLKPSNGILSGLRVSQQECKKKNSVKVQDGIVEEHDHVTEEKRVSFSDNLKDERTKKLFESDKTKYSISRILFRRHPEGLAKAGINLSIMSDPLLSIEDKAEDEILCTPEPFKDFIDSIKIERDMYLKLAETTPGFFAKTIYTDDVGEAAAELKPILCDAFRKGSSHLKDLPDYNNRCNFPDRCRRQLCYESSEEFAEEEHERTSQTPSTTFECSSCDCIYMNKH